MCCKKTVLKNRPIVTGKTPVLESLFNKVADLQAFRCFLVNIKKFFERTSAASESSFYVKKKVFISKFQQSDRKISMSVLQSCFPLAEVTNNFLVS